jgi:hypothetical protein
MEALGDGKVIADANVAKSLYSRAVGMTTPDTHVSNFQGDITLTEVTRHIAPDVKACLSWLKNRQSKLWGEKPEKSTVLHVNNIMPVPVAASVDDWEQAAQNQQDEMLNGSK